MKVTVAVTIISLFFIGSCGADWLDGDVGVDRPNGDLPNMPILFNSTQNAFDCAKMCLANVDCVAWAYCVPNCGGGEAASCYLKQNMTSQAANPCRVRRYLKSLWQVYILPVY